MNRILSSFFIVSLLQIILFVSQAKSQTVSDWILPLQLCWQFAADEMGTFPVLSDSKQISFLPFADGSITAIETISGKVIWRSEFGGEFAAEPFFNEGRIFLLSRVPDDPGENYILRAVSSNSGLTVFQKRLALNKTTGAFLLADGKRIYILSEQGFIGAYNQSDGDLNWSAQMPGAIGSTPLLSENRIFVATENKQITVLSAADGSAVNILETDNPVYGNMFVTDGVLFFGDRLGNICAIRISDRKLLWKFRTGAGIVDIAAVKDDILVTSNDGFVYMLSQNSGRRVWKQRLAGRLIGKTLLNHRYLLVQTLDGNIVPVLDSERGRVINQINLADGTFTINGAASDGKMLVIPTNRGLQAFANNCQNQ